MSKERSATFTHEADAVAGHLYYFKVSGRAAPPYKTQIHVDAIIDIADDGSLAGVELIEDMPPPPLEAASSTPDWKCPQCRCTSYARVEERKPGETKFTSGDSVRCVNCKFVSYLPVISPNAGEIEAGGEVDGPADWSVLFSEAVAAYGGVRPTARLINVSPSTVSRLARGEAPDPKTAKIVGAAIGQCPCCNQLWPARAVLKESRL